MAYTKKAFMMKGDFKHLINARKEARVSQSAQSILNEVKL